MAWPSAGDLVARGAALRVFLKSRRARLSPDDFGAPTRELRRGRGVRQEDVARLAGVSPRWYEAFERGKMCRRCSTAFVTRIADALRLNPHERATLCRLALAEVAETVEHFENCDQHCDEA